MENHWPFFVTDCFCQISAEHFETVSDIIENPSHCEILKVDIGPKL